MDMESVESTELRAVVTQSNVVEPDLEMLKGLFCVKSLIAKRDHAAVYTVTDQFFSSYAMKVQRFREDTRALADEFAIYQKLLLHSGDSIPMAGFPLIYWYRKCNGLEYLVMEHLGESLDDIANKMDQRQMDKKDVLMIALQAVRILRHLHKNGILHRDIKPRNFLMGGGPNTERTVHLINFGVQITAGDWDKYDYERTVPFAGTEYFAAGEALLHKPPTRRGDMESLGYMLAFLSYGDLPWIIWDLDTGRQIPHSEMAHRRMACKTNRLCEDFPALEEFVKVVLQTPPREEPDYERLTRILEEGLSAENTSDDGQFAWLPRRMLSPHVNDIRLGKKPANQAESHRPISFRPPKELTVEVIEHPVIID